MTATHAVFFLNGRHASHLRAPRLFFVLLRNALAKQHPPLPYVHTYTQNVLVPTLVDTNLLPSSVQASCAPRCEGRSYDSTKLKPQYQPSVEYVVGRDDTAGQVTRNDGYSWQTGCPKLSDGIVHMSEQDGIPGLVRSPLNEGDVCSYTGQPNDVVPPDWVNPMGTVGTISKISDVRAPLRLLAPDALDALDAHGVLHLTHRCFRCLVACRLLVACRSGCRSRTCAT